MGLSRRKFTREMKLAAVQQLEAGSSAAEVARVFEISPNLLHRWRKEFRHGPGNAFPGMGKRRWDQTQVAQLERKVGQQALEIALLRETQIRQSPLNKNIKSPGQSEVFRRTMAQVSRNYWATVNAEEKRERARKSALARWRRGCHGSETP